MTKIVVLTSTRAEFGLLRLLIDRLNESEKFKVEIVATGSHLSAEFGATVDEISVAGLPVAECIPILLSGDTPVDISKTMGLAMIGFADYFERSKPDWLMVLGDRYETLAVCCAATNARIPIIHLYGGEATEGALDESYRHAITKLSLLHFTSTDGNRKRVIQLGENPKRVFTVGAMGIENITQLSLLGRQTLADELSFPLDGPYAVVTFHPATVENNMAARQVEQLLHAIQQFPEMAFLFTGANADTGGHEINRMINSYASRHPNMAVYASLGTVRYLSALKYARMVIGNSSSGLIEAPSLGIPTINIGDRQKGRERGLSVIDCAPDCDAIVSAIHKAQDPYFRSLIKSAPNPYGDGHTSRKIVNILERICRADTSVQKSFWDIRSTGDESRLEI